MPLRNGDGSHLLKVRAENTNSLEKLLSRIQSWPGVLSTKTSVVLSTIKESTVIKHNTINSRRNKWQKLPSLQPMWINY